MDVIVLGVDRMSGITYHMFDMFEEDFELVYHAVRGEEGLTGLFYGNLDASLEELVNIVFSGIENQEDLDPDAILVIVPAEKRKSFVNLLESFAKSYGKNWHIRKRSGPYEMSFDGRGDEDGVTRIRLDKDSFSQNVIHPSVLKKLRDGKGGYRLQ